ncbi:hypothetical protein XFEB_01075 [Xylella fastidiosa EB92.1]|nr:hypothetical protein XFEB_01075 [Xylella fastidiosa EB92.1]
MGLAGIREDHQSLDPAYQSTEMVKVSVLHLITRLQFHDLSAVRQRLPLLQYPPDWKHNNHLQKQVHTVLIRCLKSFTQIGFRIYTRLQTLPFLTPSHNESTSFYRKL